MENEWRQKLQFLNYETLGIVHLHRVKFPKAGRTTLIIRIGLHRHLYPCIRAQEQLGMHRLTDTACYKSLISGAWSACVPMYGIHIGTNTQI